MGVSTLDGTIEEASLKRSVRNLRVFHQIRFRLRDGSTETIVKPIVDESVAPLLQPGASGRFYIFKALDHRGIHGVRDDQGHAAFRFPKNNETAVLVTIVVATLWVVVTLILRGGVPIFGALMLLGFTPYYFHLQMLRGESQRQFDSDSRYAPAVPPAAAPAVGAGPAVGT